MIDPIFARLKLDFGEDIKVVRINADENLRLANTYRLTSLPTILLFQNGNALQRLDEFRSGDDLRRALGDLQIILHQHVHSVTV
jgi:thioredoxin 1